tara:strand:+ start:1339 stop:1989 length:651 start_codon:yes stop_codon:yes gene_type:complete
MGNKGQISSILKQGWEKISHSKDFDELSNNVFAAISDLFHLRDDDTLRPNDNPIVMKMQEEFYNIYGPEGVEIIFEKLIRDPELNGYKRPDEKTGEYYKGMEYSIPLAHFAIDCALKYITLSEHFSKDFEDGYIFESDTYRQNVYDQFVEDVNVMFKHSKRDPETEDGHIPIPTQEKLEEITFPHLVNLINVAKKLKAKNFMGPINPDNDSQELVS